jgi:hypothetical protein
MAEIETRGKKRPDIPGFVPFVAKKPLTDAFIKKARAEGRA